MGQVMFYAISRAPLEDTAAVLLSRAQAQGWRVMIRGTDPVRLGRLDDRLWLVPEDGFVPHGMAGGPRDADQPVLLGTGPATNGADCLMLIDGAEVTLAEAQAMARVMVLFEASVEAAKTAARLQWKSLTGAGLTAQFWSEASGKWVKEAQSGG